MDEKTKEIIKLHLQLVQIRTEHYMKQCTDRISVENALRILDEEIAKELEVI